MAGKRKRGRKRSGRRRRSGKRGGVRVPMGRVPKNELKYKETTSITADATAGGLIDANAAATPWIANPGSILLNGLGEGASPVQRIGRQVIMKSILLQFALGFVATYKGAIRVMMVYDSANNGATPTAATLHTSLLADTSIVSPNNLDNRERYRVLMDKRFTVDAGVKSSIVLFKKFKRLNLPVQYKADDATSAGINVGALWLLVLNAGPVATVTHLPDQYWYSRIRYWDS